MGSDLRATIERVTGRRVVGGCGASGGCINEAGVYELDDGSRVFAKTHPEAGLLPGMFRAEAAGLTTLAEVGSPLAVPRPIAAGDDYLVMEAIDVAGKGAGFEALLGRGLAELHRASQREGGQRFGFDDDNYLGSTPQANTWCEDWVTFWAERRLKPMLQLTRDGGELGRLGGRLLDRLDEVLAEPVPGEAGVLLHGDLWSGNAAMARDGRAAIFDPACYFGHREAEFGMTRLFGFGSRFEAAYGEVWPLGEGADRRIRVYTLHHLLNHLALFGAGYYGSSVEMLRRIV